MLWKGLVVSGAVAVVVFAVIAALAFSPVPAGGTLAQPAAGNVMVLPNGVAAAPQLQPAQPASAPVLVSEGSLVNLVGIARDSAETTALKLAAERQTATDAAEQKALMGCGGK